MSALSNDYHACQLILIEGNEGSSPLIIVQEAYDPGDLSARVRLFYLQRDGQWIDEIARSARPESEVGDIVFENAAQAVELLSSLGAEVRIRQLSVTVADIENYMARLRGAGSARALAQALAMRYRASRGAA